MKISRKQMAPMPKSESKFLFNVKGFICLDVEKDREKFFKDFDAPFMEGVWDVLNTSCLPQDILWDCFEAGNISAKEYENELDPEFQNQFPCHYGEWVTAVLIRPEYTRFGMEIDHLEQEGLLWGHPGNNGEYFFYQQGSSLWVAIAGDSHFLVLEN